jgi:hypothetical protein
MSISHTFFRLFNRLPLPVYPFRMYMHRHRCIFIHIPKCAGSAILQVLGHTGGRDHVEWRHYVGSNPAWFRSYHKFAVCRHPLLRLKSAYDYCVAGGNQSEQDKELQIFIQAHCQNLEEFIQNVLSHDFINENILFKPQYLFVYSRSGRCQLDQILRHESLSQDWQKMALAHGYPKTLQKINASKGNTETLISLSQTLSIDSLKKIETLYHKDFELFQYPMSSQ